MLGEEQIGGIVIDKLWDEGLIVDSHTRRRIEANCTLHHFASILGAHVNAGDEERLQRCRTLMQRVALGALTPSWAHWYLLVWHGRPPALQTYDFARIVSAMSTMFSESTSQPDKLNMLTRIVDRGMAFGHDTHAGMPERAANDETLVLEVAEAHATHYF